MKILLAHRYYWPDQPPCAQIMREVAKKLASQGHTVDVLTSQPSYRDKKSNLKMDKFEQVDFVNIIRLSLPNETHSPMRRILNAIYMGYRLLFRSIFNNYDLIIITTVPPVLGGFFAAISAKLTGAKLIYYCMDLNPEIGQISGDFVNPVLCRILLALDELTCLKADLVLVHSQDMLQSLRKRPRGSNYKISLLNNFAIPTQTIIPDGRDWTMRGEDINLQIIYAGNIGRFQNLENIAKCMAPIAHRKDIELLMVGDGVMKPKLIHLRNEMNLNIKFLSHQQPHIIKKLIKDSDLGLVSLAPNLYKYAYPSKTMAYLEQGCPIITTVESNSELVSTMLDEEYGFAVSDADPNAFSQLLLQLADTYSWRPLMQKAAAASFERHFSSSKQLSRWCALVSEFSGE